MPTGLIFVLLAGFAMDRAVAPQERPAAWTHVRAFTRGAATLLDEAVRRSPTTRSLLDALEGTDLIVCVTVARSGLVREPAGYLAFLARTGSVRYVMVCIDPMRVAPPGGIAVLAHELHHALEVAAAPEVADSASLGRLFERTGWLVRVRQFESDRAQEVGQRVMFELTGRGR